jgi:hypothetical protein
MSRAVRGWFCRNSDHVEPATASAHLNTVELDWYLRRQSGVISCAQARAAGLSQDAGRRDLPYLDLIGVRDLWVTDLPLSVFEAAIALGPQGSELFWKR